MRNENASLLHDNAIFNVKHEESKIEKHNF
jgi:hypothetical protein